MKYRPSIAFNEFSGTARNVTASSNAAGCYLHAKSHGGHSSATRQQQEVKALFGALQKSWKDLSQAERNQWDNAADSQQGRSVLGQNAKITGINLYQRLNFWVVKCGGTALTTPPLLSGVEAPADCTAAASQNRIGIRLQHAPQESGLKLVILVSAPQTVGTVKGVGRGASCTDPFTPGTGFIDLRESYIGKYGVPTSGMPKIFFRYFLVNPVTGEKSLEKLATAIYAEEVLTHVLNVMANDSDFGSVSPSGSVQYPHGTSVTVTATPAHGYTFTRWSDGGSQNPRTIVLNDDLELTAVFAVDQHRRITVEATPTGNGSVEGGGSYLIGQQVTLEAIPEEGCYFDHWEDDEWLPATRTVTVEDDASYHAIFKRGYMRYKLQLSANKPILGTTDPEPDEYFIDAEDTMTVYAVPDTMNDAEFVGWSDGNTDNPRVFEGTHNQRVQAIFQTDLEATVNVEIEGEGSVTGTGDYHIGDTAILRAIPDAGYTFTGWDDGVTDAERTIVVEDSVWLTATFEEEE